MNRKAIIYVHGKGGCADEAGHYSSLFPDSDVLGFDYHSATPWEAKEEFTAYFDEISKRYASVQLIANSIGAYFSMNALNSGCIERAYFISPIVNMQKLICDMMLWAGVTEEQLKEKGTVETAFGETLSWEYLSWVRNNQLIWDVPTAILRGGGDNLQSDETIREFAVKTGAEITVMENGEHWFHTEEQMAFLDAWIKQVAAAL